MRRIGFLDRVKSGFPTRWRARHALLTLEVTPTTATRRAAPSNPTVTSTTTVPFKANAVVVGVYGRERIRGAAAAAPDALVGADAPRARSRAKSPPLSVSSHPWRQT